MKRTERHKDRRSGFALPDLMTLLVLAGVSVSMLLPSIQQIRENSKKEDCANRLREIAFATHLFHSVNERLPSTLGAEGAVDSSDFGQITNDFKNTSALAQVAPFMGLSSIFDDTDPIILELDSLILDNGYSGTSEFWFSDDSINRSVVQDVPEFTCPSDNINQFEANGGQTHSVFQFDQFSSMSLVVWLPDPNSKLPLLPNARTNFTACAGASSGGLNLLGTEFGNYSGAIGWREEINMFSLPDGLSNTVMFGENIGTIQISEKGLYQRDFTPFWFMGATSQMRGGVGWMAEPPLNTRTGAIGFFSILNADTPDFPDPSTKPDPSQGILGDANHARTTGFGSMHPAGVNFVFLDGSVRTVGRTDDWRSLYAIAGAYDGATDFELSRPGKRK